MRYSHLAPEWVQRLKDLAKAAENRREEIENQRCLPDDLAQSLKESEVLRLWVAKEYGGKEAPIGSLLEAVQTLAYHNASLAWVAAVTGTASLASGYLEPDRAQEIFANPLAMTGGWAVPAGKAQKVSGGIRVQGSWAWGSGISHCSHIVGGALLSREPGAKLESILVYFEPDQVKFQDTWKVLGLKGTHSIHYKVEDAFIPEGRWIPFPVQKAQLDRPLYRFSFLGALASGVASVGLGIAERALEEIRHVCLEKIPAGGRKPLSEKARVQEQIARIWAKYRAAQAFLEQSVQEAWEESKNAKVGLKAKSQLRLAATYAVEQAQEVVQEAYKLGGGSSIWQGVKLEELLRDIQVVSQHGLINAQLYEVVGQASLGIGVREELL